MPATPGSIDLSIVAPAHNEQDNLVGLVDDVRAAIDPTGLDYELILVDDGSDDDTVAVGKRLAEDPANRLRVVSLATPPGRGLGPSAGYAMGIRLARGVLVAIMDADRQNDPGDIPAMIARMRESGADMVQGDRSANRRDNLVRRWSSWVGRSCRGAVLGDDIRDSACAMRLFTAEAARAVPLHFKGMHRFAAYYARVAGFKVVQMPVNHRPRVAGKAKFGIWNRALPGLLDLLAVRWMRSRWRDIRLRDEPGESAGDARA